MKTDKTPPQCLLITPQKASQFLMNAAPNRPMSDGKIAKFAVDMKAGNWKLTHQGIGLTTDGRLLDGQNRLQAIINSGVSVYMWVTHGVDPDTFDVIDTGTSKTGHDVLAMMGVTPRQSRIIASAVPYCISYEAGNAPTKSLSGKILGNSNLVVANYFNNNPTISRSARFIARMPRRDALLKESLSCFFHYQISKNRKNDADVFLIYLLTGEGIESDSIIFEMRKQLIASRIGNFRLIEPTIIKRIIVTYNFFHSGRRTIDPRQIVRRADKIDNPRIV